MRRVWTVAGLCLLMSGAAAWAAVHPNHKTVRPKTSAHHRRRHAHHRHVVKRKAHHSTSHTTAKPPITTVAAGDPVLFGNQAIESGHDYNDSGFAQAFPFANSTAGTTGSISVYVDSYNRATKIYAGLYTDNNGHPGSLIVSGSLQSPKSGAWNNVLVPSVAVSPGRTYWVAVLGTGGTLLFRDRTNGPCVTEVSSQSGLSSLSATWKTGQQWTAYCPISAYVNGYLMTTTTTTTTPTTTTTTTTTTPATTTTTTSTTTPTTTTTTTMAPPSNTALPAISGTATQGQTLSVSNGTWSGSPTGYSYQWKDCDSLGANCTNVSGATSGSYTLASGDVGHTMLAVVTATNAGGTTPSTSSATAVVVPVPPTAVFSSSPNPVTGQVVHFDASGSTCSATPCTYTWADVPPTGGTWPLGSGQTLDFTFQDVGTKYVTLTVTDAWNQSAKVEHDVAVAAAPPAPPAPPANTALPTISGTSTQGQTLSVSNGTWSGSPTSYNYQWKACDSSGNNCTNISGASGSSYLLAAGDVGHTVRAAVTVTNASGSASATSAQSAAIQSAPTGGGATVVGAAAEPNVSCTSTISAGASVQSALAAASPGQVVCLNAGTWAKQTIAGLTPASPGVTLAAKPGAAVTMAGLTTNGTVNNLTVEGIKFTAGLLVLASGNNITVQYNTFENFADYAVEGCPACTVSSNDLSNFKVLYNQIDHTAYCLRAAANSMSNWTFSHNVCGPGIGYGGNSDDHYTQTECMNGLTMDNNAFLGPFDSSGLNNGVHNNVTHACGSNLEFNNNVVWHADSRAQTLLWGDDGTVNTARANNNLFVEDPNCGALCPTVSLWAENAYGASNETYSNNTIVANTGGSSGGIWTRSGISNMVSQNNIAVGNTGGDGDFSFSSCATCTGNVANDGSGNVNWSPGWQSTSWTPNNGSPWNPPPSTYYKPVVSGGVSASGYQGTIGP
jgi:hypothetical protein